MGSAVSFVKKPSKNHRSNSIATIDAQIASPGESNSRLDISNNQQQQHQQQPPRGGGGGGISLVSAFHQPSPSPLAPSSNGAATSNYSPYIQRSPLARLYSFEQSPVMTPIRRLSHDRGGAAGSHLSNISPRSNSSGHSHLSHPSYLIHHHHHPPTSEGEEEGEGESPRDPGMADLFAQTAMSLGLEGDDLLFNMMYFDDGGTETLGQLLNTLQQETLALHSEHNTPYRLHPADEAAIAGLHEEKFHCHITGEENECLVCRDEIEEESIILRIPTCKHYFHQDCLLKWIKLQGWCPVCRTSLDTLIKPSEKRLKNNNHPPTMEAVTEAVNSQDDNEEDSHKNHQTTTVTGLMFPTFEIADGRSQKSRMNWETKAGNENEEVNDENEFEDSPLSRKLMFENQSLLRNIEEEEERAILMFTAESKHSKKFQPVDEKSQRKSVNEDKKREEEQISPVPLYTMNHEETIEQQLARESAEKLVFNAMNAFYQEKLAV